MEENCLIEVVGELESDSETVLKTSETETFVFKNVACQAVSHTSQEGEIPIMFCTLFSSVNEASTQVSLPGKSNGVSVSHVYKIPPLSGGSKDSKVKAEEDRKPDEKQRIPPISGEKSDSEIKAKEDKTSGEKRKECLTDYTLEETDVEYPRKNGNEAFSVHSDIDDLEDEPNLPSSPEGDEENTPENSEFSSDSDCAFWQKMRKQLKEKKSRSSSKKLKRKYPSGFSITSIKESKSISLNSQKTVQKLDAQQSTTKSKENGKTLFECGGGGGGGGAQDEPGSKDNWITDDEFDDEEGMNLDLAFKREWKEKRLPYNSKEKNFVCEICCKQYSKHSYLRAHIVREHKEHELAKKYAYHCQYCRRVYNGERYLLHHQQQHTGPCEICGVVLECSGLFWAHRRNHDAVCKVCSKSFQNRSSLDMHMRIKHTEKTVPCPKCSRMFPFEFMKNKHISKAHRTKELTQYKCSLCDFWSMTETSLRIHQRRIHKLKLEMYTCKGCNKKFRTKLSYNNHVAYHISKSNIVCHLCSQKFLSDSDLQAHKKSVHEAVGITIESKETTISIQSEDHQMSSYYPCAVCSVAFDSYEKLCSHMERFHDRNASNTSVEMKQETVESIQLTEADENAIPLMHISVENEESDPYVHDRPIKTEPKSLDFTSDFDCSGIRSALLMPASVVPPDVNMVDINGVQYQVIRGPQ